MWKPGSRSSALDRAQAVLSSRKGREAPATRTNCRTAVTDVVFSDLSDLFSVSSASTPEQKVHLKGPANGADQEGEGPPKVARPASSLGGGVNRFLKKTPTAVQHEPKARNVSSSLQASQTAALSKLVEIESRFGKCMQTKSPLRQGQKPGQDVILEHSASVQSSSKQSLTGKHFLKNKALVLDDAPPPAAVTPREKEQVSDSREKLHPDAPAAALHQSPESSSRPSSPFQFTGQAQARFSQFSLSPTPSPPCLSPSLGLGTHRSSSPVSASAQVLSLEELFPFGAASEDSHDASSTYSGHFKINVMDLEDLGPDTIEFNEDTKGKDPSNFLMERKDQGKQQEEEELDYQSDFESVTSELNSSLSSEISEHIQGEAGDPLPSHVSEAQTEYDYSNTFTDTNGTRYSKTLDGSRTEKLLSRSPVSPRPHVKSLRDTAVQTHDGVTSVGSSFMFPGLETARRFSPEYVNAHISYSPSMLILIETLKQQLALTAQFISSSCDLHSRLVQSLEPPNYKYTTLEDTEKNMCQYRASRISTEQALQEMKQDMRDQQHR